MLDDFRLVRAGDQMSTDVDLQKRLRLWGRMASRLRWHMRLLIDHKLSIAPEVFLRSTLRGGLTNF
jgi:hypothetical protein